MIRRHPHVFEPDGRRLEHAAEVVTQWNELKRRESAVGDAPASALGELPAALPTLARAQKAQERAARVGFDWPGTGIAELLGKLREETRELDDAVKSGEPAAIEDEVGDIFFTLVNLARRLGVDSDLSASRATAKFIRRFRAAESMLAARGLPAETAGLALWDECWEAAKRSEMSPPNAQGKGEGQPCHDRPDSGRIV